ncbi:hypothetical protein J1TS3_12080 [Siminovitchia fordii]|uniref:Uncharacterized protein n=1 Tax=Siminovitchia fordii TaxID=254759 RepID=A0ABQ4K2U0_9BACI|nr:hypothetical protein J1TS3_12080 [Siminovitchia fordii]
MRLILYALFFTILAFLITSLINWSFIEALTINNILKYIGFFIVLLISFNIIERRNRNKKMLQRIHIW